MHPHLLYCYISQCCNLEGRMKQYAVRVWVQTVFVTSAKVSQSSSRCLQAIILESHRGTADGILQSPAKPRFKRQSCSREILQCGGLAELIKKLNTRYKYRLSTISHQPWDIRRVAPVLIFHSSRSFSPVLNTKSSFAIVCQVCSSMVVRRRASWV